MRITRGGNIEFSYHEDIYGAPGTVIFYHQ